MMQRFLLGCIAVISSIATAEAATFVWFQQFAMDVQTDLPGFEVRLQTRFKLDEPQVRHVLTQMDEAADAYLVLRLAEMAGKAPDDAILIYKKHHQRGWGALAHEFGIKPGSREFQRLRRGSDLDLKMMDNEYTDDHPGKGKHRGRGHGKPHERN